LIFYRFPKSVLFSLHPLIERSKQMDEAIHKWPNHDVLSVGQQPICLYQLEFLIGNSPEKNLIDPKLLAH
jgi:hypothetical protein